MSSTKLEGEEEGGGPKSSKDILNELFSTFNTSFDEDAADKDKGDGGKKKKKKSKKAKKERGDGDGDDEGGQSSKKKKHRKQDKDKEWVNGVDKDKEKKRKRSGDGHGDQVEEGREDEGVDGCDEDVNRLIKKHRHKVKSQFKGIISSIGDIVIKNDELIKSKSKQGEDDILRAAGKEKKEDVEDGEIFEDEKGNKEKKERKHKKVKMSASMAYKLDMEEKMLLGMEDPAQKRKKERTTSTSSSKHKSNAEHLVHSEKKRHNVRVDEHEHSSSSSSHKENHRHKTSNRVSDDNKIRHAPPRTPSPPSAPPERSHRKYSYNDTNWQRADHHYLDGYNGRRRDGDRDRDRDYDRERNYDVGIYYEREANRRSDGRGFGFPPRSYYDDPVEHGDRRSHRHPHPHQHDDRDRRRDRSRSPRSRGGRSSRRSRSRSPPRWRRSRSRSWERRRHPDDIIDKAKLLEIARKNASKLMKRGCLPSDIFSRDQLVAIRAGGKNVEELTDYCRKLAKKDAHGDAMSDDSGVSDGEDHFMHHPFQVKDRPLPQITMNIRNAVPIPIRTPHEMAIESAKLKISFPVSSGTQHRIKELEWHPVNKEEEEKKAKAAEETAKANSLALVPLDAPADPSPKADSPSSAPATPLAESVPAETSSTVTDSVPAIESAPAKINFEFERPKAPDFDIGDVIALRLKAMRQLGENPNSGDAKTQLEKATKMMKTWADAKALEPKFLSQSELTQGPQAWAKRDQLVNAKEVQSPMGLHLLQKMGWKPGEGLGKTKSGDIQPLALEVKTDKKGLTSVLDYKKGPALPLVYDLSGKHPISALMELCAKRKWGAPDFDLVFEHGPPHKKQFVYKVVVNGVEYQPCVAVNNKKLAKANSAAFCLQSLGLLPTAPVQEAQDTLQTVPPLPDPLPPPPPPPPPNQSDNQQQGAGLRFTAAHYLQTVPSNAPSSMQPPLPPSVLMPPPPPPPPQK